MTKNKRYNGLKPVIPELLAPAGNLEKLKTAIHYGADAVYLGGKELSLRAKAGNFSLDEMEEGICFAHSYNKKAYVTANIIAHNSDLEGLEKYIDAICNMGADGIIVADPGILDIVQKKNSQLPIHLSTQANITNHASAKFWFRHGASRINLARELSFDEIADIRRRVNGELEVFVHGALCISYSGRCMLSLYLTDRDANKGMCSHPCRYSYTLTEEKRPGKYFPVEEDDRGTYIFNSKDLCLLTLLPELLAVGVDSLKIEGRMKSIFYVGGVVRVYRAVLSYLENLPEEAWEDPTSIVIPKIFIDEIKKTGTRGITENFSKKKPTQEDMLYKNSRAEQHEEPVAVIRKTVAGVLVEVRNRLATGEAIEYMGRDMTSQHVILKAMKTEKNEIISVANPGNIVFLHTEPELQNVDVYGIFRRKKKEQV